MSPAPLAQPNSLTTQAHQVPGPMRRPSLSLSPPPSPSNGATVSAAMAGSDVTPTSPSPAAIAGSLVSIRPLPSPSFYQPPASVPASASPALSTQPEPSVVSISSTSQAYVPSYPPPSLASPSIPPPSSASSVSSMGESSATQIKYKENTGRWLTEEHEVFLQGLDQHGKQWKKIALMIKTRSVVQVRTHAQKYFQKLLKGDKKEDGRLGKERTSSIISASTAVSTASSPAGTGASTPVKRKSSSSAKGGSKAASNKKRRVSLEPKPKKHHQQLVATQYQYLPLPTPYDASAVDHTVIDPSFMHTLNMAEGELDDSLLDLLDDSSIDAVEKVIGTHGDDLEPNPVTPSISSVSLDDNAAKATMTRTVSVGVESAMMGDRQDMVTSPNPTEDFSIHNKIGTSSLTELSPTSVTCTMDIKDFEQKTGNYTDAALDWLMDDGWRQLPASDGEEDWSSTYPSTAPKALLAPPLTATQNKTAALPAVGNDFV